LIALDNIHWLKSFLSKQCLLSNLYTQVPIYPFKCLDSLRRIELMGENCTSTVRAVASL